MVKSSRKFAFVAFANNSLVTKSLGMSGGDNILIQILLKFSTLKIKTTIFCGSNLRDFLIYKIVLFVIIIFKKKGYDVFGNIYINTLFKTILGIIQVLKFKHENSTIEFCYSASDFYPDVIPAIFYKIKFKSIWIATFYQNAVPPWEEQSPYKNRFFLKGLIYWLGQIPIYYLIKNYADLVFVTSEPDIKFFVTKTRQVDKILVIKGGVDLQEIDKFIKKNSKTVKKYDACFLGRLHIQKGLYELLDIWQIVVKKKPNAKLVIIGNGELYRDVERRITKFNLSNHIILTGYLNGKDKYRELIRSKIILHPAIYDSGGMAAAEAMAFGLPGISFDLESLKTYYPKGMIKIPCFDKNKFADEIVNLLSNKTEYNACSRDARNQIVSEWSWEKRIKDIVTTLNTYEKSY
jgi:glycosyltransferase involved in cell wall biosynthesis